MSGIKKLIDCIEIDLRDIRTNQLITIYIDVYDNSLSRRWLSELKSLLQNKYHLEKNYCFLGFPKSLRDASYMCNYINQSIEAINRANLGYQINDQFTVENTLTSGPVGEDLPGCLVNHDKFNMLHRYFEDLQGVSGQISHFYKQADGATRWHIRQLNLLCHEFESWALSYRKHAYAPEWSRPSQLMCWLNAPRFMLEPDDYELFGVDTIGRPLGGVFVGVNKAVGKHHWEVFNDEGGDSRLDELTTTTLRSQTEAAGDFDIEWSRDPSPFFWQQEKLRKFREWLIANGFDPENKALTIGHPQVGQVDLQRSFGSDKYDYIWNILSNHLDVYSIRIDDIVTNYDYHWSDADFIERQVKIIEGN